MIIDGHCHAGRGDGMTAPWNSAADLSHYLRRAQAAGITKSVVFSAFHSNYALANRQLAEIVRQHAPRLIGFAMVHCVRNRGSMRRLIADGLRMGLRGIKVHGHEAPAGREVCEAAREFSLPLLYDPAGKVDHVGIMAGEYPQVRFIIPHFGSFSDDWRAQSRCVDLLTRYPNVFADTSGVRRFDILKDAVQRAGAHKIIFGSDGPWLHPGLELHKIKLLGLLPNDEQRIIGKNLAQILQRPAAAQAA